MSDSFYISGSHLFLFSIAHLESYVKREGSMLLKFTISKAEKYQAETRSGRSHRNKLLNC